MRWSLVGNIFLFAINLLNAQTYIIKFKNDVVDELFVRSTVLNELQRNKIQQNQSISFSVQTFPSSTIPKNSTFQWNRYAILTFTQIQSEQSLQLIAANDEVEYIHSSVNYKVYSVPNDSAYSLQWNLKRIGISSLWENGTINNSIPSVKVGVIDTGIDDVHPDLVNSISYNQGEMGNGKETNGIDDDANGFIDDWRGYDFVDSESEDIGDWNERDNHPKDEHGHGTSVSGIIAAQTNNGLGLAGIVPAKILPLRAFGKNGNGNDIDIASALVYAVDNGVDVINMSFGDVIQSPLLHDAIKYAYSKNVVLIASSGNDGSNYPHYPSDFSEVISTGSTGQTDVRSFFSSYSPSLDIMAPGEQIITTTLGGEYTDQFAGTSAASPHVAGVSALIKSLEKKKKLANQNYVVLSNEEIRGILLNSANDAGEKGWDKFYGAGIVNAEKAIQAVSGSNVVIHSPRLDENLIGNSVPIVVTASTPYLQSVELQFGVGENPNTWTQIFFNDSKIFIRDTLTNWNITSFIPNVYILRLVVKNSKDNDIEFRQRIVIDTSPPKILSFRFRDSVILGNEYGALIEARIDRNSYGTLYYRKIGDIQYKSIQSLGLQLNHSFILSLLELNSNIDYEFYCQFTENSSSKRIVKFPTNALAGLEHFPIKLSSQTIQTTGFIKKNFQLPKGYLLNTVQTINTKPNLILNEYTVDNDFGKLKSYEFIGNNFIVKDSSERSWVPRSFIKNSGEGKPVVLVQDRGFSQLLQIDTVNGKFFNQPIWGDSSDVWASQMNDLDNDNKPEIIARSSSEYLIYKNLGNNNFSLVTRLTNPSTPLFGEARNQFGPPRSIVGDFTNSGVKEIIFADYDGDVLLYRQSSPNSLNFQLIGIDSSDLYEMSDYITSGDYNGDGILDFVVAGHSNLDWNQDREYNTPVWTVKVYSHLTNSPAGTVSKIWEQHFVGVKAGSRYDNGIVSGKLKTSDSKDALLISFNPLLYIFEWDGIKNTFVSKWNHSSLSNSVIFYDFDGDTYNEIGFHSNGKTEFWSLENTSITAAPFGITSASLSSSKIRLQWNSSASSHKIFRGTHPDSLVNITTTNNVVEFIDSNLIANKTYYYSVSALGLTESSPSDIVSIIPHSAVTITSVNQVSLNQLTVDVSFDVSSNNLSTAIFLLDSSIATSSIVWRSSRSFLLSFAINISLGLHSLRIKNLLDASGMNGDTTQVFGFTAYQQEEQLFFVREISLISSNKIQIEFSQNPNMSEARKSLNYTVKTIARQFSISSIDSIQPNKIILNINAANLTDIALRLEVRLSETIISAAGVLLNGGKGQVLSIAQEAKSIENIVVYPNPARNSEQITFVNIPDNCRISIYSINGEKIKIFSDLTTNEGISWNLRDEKGVFVSTGIYMYRVEQMNSANEILNTKLGKFAVIR